MQTAELSPDLRLMPLREAKMMLPFEVSDSTFVRWTRDGVQNFYGTPVKLRTEKCGGRQMTCLRWILEFRAAVQRPSENPPQLVADGTAERAESARQQLAELLGGVTTHPSGIGASSPPHNPPAASRPQRLAHSSATEHPGPQVAPCDREMGNECYERAEQTET
jgi:hypothetical protein